MNDRFKFRLFCIEDGTYCVGVHLIGGGDMIHEAVTNTNWNNSGSFIIEQCTGFSDKNGNLIYEGDKVEISVYGDVINEGFVETDTQYQGIVVWAKQGFYVKVVDDFFYIPEEPENVEIIGNIHEQAEQKDK